MKLQTLDQMPSSQPASRCLRLYLLGARPGDGERTGLSFLSHWAPVPDNLTPLAQD